MATVNKDFKVKNGIQVAGDAIIGGTITAAEPTIDNHVATKFYVDQLLASGSVATGSTPPQDPNNGGLWYDTIVNRLNVFYDTTWRTIATIDDVLNVPDHIHDTSIDGNGLIVSRFVDAGSIFEPQGTAVSGGDANTTDWSDTWNGGFATDNYN
jgi:hypothetical protein